MEQEKETWFGIPIKDAIEKPQVWKLVLKSEIRKAKKQQDWSDGERFRMDYAKLLKKTHVKPNYILYESFGGRGMICNPHAIFKYLLTRDDFRNYVHVWVIDDFEENRYMIEHYKNYKNVKFVKYLSPEYCEALCTCKYLINNVNFNGFFTKRPEQIYVNTWHGIHFKTVGFDTPHSNVSKGNALKNFLAADYILSPNAYTTAIDRSAFRLDGLYEGKILEEGQPRNDGLFHTDRAEILNKLRAVGVDFDPDKKLILYAPTWRGEQYQDPDTDLEEYFRVIDAVTGNADTGKYQILVKPHQIVYNHIKERADITGQFVPAVIDTNELLSVTDVLISDYSSIFFDFMVTGRPMLFYIPDLDAFADQRGFYYSTDRLPGPVAKTIGELKAMVKDPEKAAQPLRDLYEKEAAWVCPKDDGNVCARIVDVVFQGKASDNLISCEPQNKEKILLYAGDFLYKKRVDSLQILAKYLDYEKYDVSLLALGKEERALQRIEEIPGQIRVLYRKRPMNATLEEYMQHEMWMRQEKKLAVLPDAFYEREAARLFGMSTFDQIVNLTGTTNFFSELFSHMKAKKVHIFDENFAKSSDPKALYDKLEEMLEQNRIEKIEK